MLSIGVAGAFGVAVLILLPDRNETAEPPESETPDSLLVDRDSSGSRRLQATSDNPYEPPTVE